MSEAVPVEQSSDGITKPRRAGGPARFLTDVMVDLGLVDRDPRRLGDRPVVARRQGMRLLRDDGLEKVRLGMTSIAEVTRVTGTGFAAVE
ncbi:MAG: hypothetical protein WKF42_04050 [Solirubrobacteraceae bacterium]